MAKFYVTLEETVKYTVEVEADDEDDAREFAVEAWVQSGDPTTDFDGQGEGVTVTTVCEAE